MEVVDSPSSSESDEQTLPPATPEQIITFTDGKFSFDASKFAEIISNIPDSCEDISVACICIIGQPKSGKSFLTNLILQSLMVNGEGNWIGKVTKRQDKLNGFSWNENGKINDEKTSNVSLWSRPFVMKRCNGEPIILFVLDCSIDVENTEIQKAFEVLIWLLCSTVVVTQLNNIDLDLLNLRKKLLDSHPSPISSQIYWVIQNAKVSVNSISYGKPSEPKFNKYVSEQLKELSNGADLLTIWEEIENKTGFAFPQPGSPNLLDEDGFLTLQTNFINRVKKFIITVLDADELDRTSNLKLATVQEYFQKCVEWTNANLMDIIPDSSQLHQKVAESIPNGVENVLDEAEDVDSGSQLIEDENMTISATDEVPSVGGVQQLESQVNDAVETCQENSQDNSTLDKIDVATPVNEDERRERILSPSETQINYPETVVLNPDIGVSNVDAVVTKEENFTENVKTSKDLMSFDETPAVSNVDAVVTKEESFTDSTKTKEKRKKGKKSKEKQDSKPKPTTENVKTSKDLMSFEETPAVANVDAVVTKEENVNDSSKTKEKRKKGKKSKEKQDGKPKPTTKNVKTSKDLMSVEETPAVKSTQEMTDSNKSGLKTVSQDCYQASSISTEKSTENSNVKPKTDVRGGNMVENEKTFGSSMTSSKQLSKSEEEISTPEPMGDEFEIVNKSDCVDHSTFEPKLEASSIYNGQEIEVQNNGQNNSGGQTNVQASTVSMQGNFQIKAGEVVEANKGQEMKKCVAKPIMDRNAASPKSDTLSKNPYVKERNEIRPTHSNSANPDFQTRSQALTQEQKQEVDQKLQHQIEQITRDYTKGLEDFLTKTGGKDELQNKHSNLLKVAEEQLQKLFLSLHLNHDDCQTMARTLKNTLQMHFSKVSKNADKLRKELLAKTTKSSNVDPTGETKPTAKKSDPAPASSCNNSESSHLEAHLQERANKLFDTYVYSLNNELQVYNDDESALRDFHQKELLKITKHFGEISQGNIPNKSKILENLTIRLDTEFSKYISPPMDDPIHFTEEELNIAVVTGMEKLLLYSISTNEHILTQYDNEMQKICGRSGRTAAEFNFAHNQFVAKWLSPQNFWNFYFAQLFASPIDLQKQNMVRDHFVRSLNKRKDYFESILKSTASTQFLRNQLVILCVDKYEAQISTKVANMIKEKGFVVESLKPLVEEAQNELVLNIVEKYCHESYFCKDDMQRLLTSSVRQFTDKISTFLTKVVETYRKQMENPFKHQICYSNDRLEICHKEATQFTINNSCLRGKSDLKDADTLCETALNFAKSWYINQNTEIRTSENNSAFAAMVAVQQFYSQEMNIILASNLCSNKILYGHHNELKNQSIAAFRKVTPFNQDKTNYGLEDYTPQLESKIDELFLEFVQINGKNLEGAVKSIKTIISNASKTFDAEVTEKLSPRCVTDQEFDEIIDGVKTQVLSQMQQQINDQVPHEGFDVHQKTMEEHINIFQDEKRKENDDRRKVELTILEKRRKEIQEDETKRGCATPTLCIEFGLKIIRVGFVGPDGNFVFAPNQSDGQLDIQNIISFLKTDEVILGVVEEEKLSQMFESISLDSLFASSSVSKDEDDDPKEINFKGGKIPVNVEFMCSIIFSKLKEAAEKLSQEQFCSAVISIPLRFHSRQRQIIKTAGLIAGFEEIYLINDTTAAAMQYFSTNQSVTSCFVVSLGLFTCDTALYKYSAEGKLQMEYSYGDKNREIKSQSSVRKFVNYLSSAFFQDDTKDDDIFLSVIKEVVKSKKKIETTILLCDNDKSVIRKCSGHLESSGLKSVVVYCNDESSMCSVLRGIGEYSQKLKKNIRQAKSSIADSRCYNFVYDDGMKSYDLPLVSRSTANCWTTNHGVTVETNENKILSFNELAEDQTRFHYGRAEFLVEKGARIQLKVDVNSEGIFNVQLMYKGMLVNIDSYNLTEEQCTTYREMIEKHFKKDPEVEALEKAKLNLIGICQDMTDRLSQAKGSDFMKENITKEIQIGIQLSKNCTVNLQAVESKIKMLESLRDKKYPKK